MIGYDFVYKECITPELQWSLPRKTAPSAVTGWSLMGVRSHIGVQNVQKILFGADKGRSHKTSRSYNRGSLVAGTTVYGHIKIGEN